MAEHARRRAAECRRARGDTIAAGRRRSADCRPARRPRRAPPARRPSRRRDRAARGLSRQSRGPRRPARKPGRDGHLTLGAVVAVKRPQFEQRDIRKAAIGVAPRRLDQVRQRARAHHVEIAADRIDEGQFGPGAAEQRRRLRRQERKRDRLGQAAFGQRAAHQFDTAAARVDRRAGHRGFARQRHRRDFVVALDPQHLLDEIGLALDVAAPGRRRHGQAAVVLGGVADRAAERFEDRAALGRRHMQPAEPGQSAPGAAYRCGAIPARRRPGRSRTARRRTIRGSAGWRFRDRGRQRPGRCRARSGSERR